MLITVAWVIVTGLTHFSAARAFDFPAGPWQFDQRTSIGLGMALAIAMYDFLGYYQVCYLGDEVADPSRTIPRSILISVVTVGLIYLIMNIGILGVIPWREVVEFQARGQRPDAAGPWPLGGRAGDRHDHLDGAGLGLCRACLGYSRIPYASARAGHFFKVFAATHPTGHFPHRSLLLISGLAMVACLADLGTVIAALLTSRILIQFVGQIATVFYLRAQRERTRSHLSHALVPLAGLVCTWPAGCSSSPRRSQPVLIYGVVVAAGGQWPPFSSGTARGVRRRTWLTAVRRTSGDFGRQADPASACLPCSRTASNIDSITTFRPGWEGVTPSPVRS